MVDHRLFINCPNNIRRHFTFHNAYLMRLPYHCVLAIMGVALFPGVGHTQETAPPYQSRIEQFNGGARSWTEARDHFVVKQRFDMSCGAAALATLLHLYYNEKTDEADIMDIIGLRDEYSFADLTYAAGEFGYKAVPLSMTFDMLVHLKVPVVLYINNFGAGHFTVFKGTDGQMVWLGDPAWGNTRLAKSDFLKRWQTGRNALAPGQVLVVLKEGQQINEAFFGLSNATISTFFIQSGIAGTVVP
ncbi:C39 family peptidase [Rhodopseudomonas sp.]|uniref:C39 family peptidase n=1 Tax=Rhodopseudomonas sp. TaxID=1078 RepID=UPI0039E59B56